jgi:hypothetical protein
MEDRWCSTCLGELVALTVNDRNQAVVIFDVSSDAQRDVELWRDIVAANTYDPNQPIETFSDSTAHVFFKKLGAFPPNGGKCPVSAGTRIDRGTIRLPV